MSESFFPPGPDSEDSTADSSQGLETLWGEFISRLRTIVENHFRDASTRIYTKSADGDFLHQIAEAARDSTFGRTGVQNEFLRMVLVLATDRQFSESENLAGILGDLVDAARHNDQQVLERLRRAVALLLEPLRDETLCEIAVRVIAGATTEELSRDFACSVASIDRKLRLIRQVWTDTIRKGQTSGTSNGIPPDQLE